MDEFRRDLLGAVALAAAGLFAFGMTVAAPVYYHDLKYMGAHPLFSKESQEVLGALFSRNYFALTGERAWQPLTTYCHWLLSGSQALWRLFGISLHLATALSVRSVTRRLAEDEFAGWAAAFLFLLFPLSTEAVFFAYFHSHIIAALSTLLGIVFWLKARESHAETQGWLWLSRIVFCVGLFGGETAALAPGLMVLHIAVFDRGDMRRRMRELGGHILILAVYLVWRWGVLIASPTLAAASARERLVNLGWYVGALIVPWPACLFRSPGVGALAWLIPYAVCVRAALRHPGVLFGLVWITLALLPALGSPAADHRLYLAVAGAAAAVSCLLARTRFRILLAPLIVAWGAGSIVHNGGFRDLLVFGERCVECAPDHPGALAFSGELHAGELDFEGARKRFEKAVALAPQDAGLRDKFGYVLFSLGRKVEAVSEFQAGVDRGSGASGWNNLGSALASVGRKEAALRAYEEAARLAPQWKTPRKNADDLRRAR
ncbi:MAG: tetratricopeptide repeat protein [Elusimicrobiota bacterium]